MTYYILLSIFTVSLTIGVIYIFTKVDKTTGNKINEYLFWTLMILFGLPLAPLSSYFITTSFNAYPEMEMSRDQNFVEMDSTSLVLNRLDGEASQLRSSLSNPKDLKISEIEDILARTLVFSDDMKELLIRQKEIILNLSDEVQTEKQKAEESQRLAREIQTLTKQQLEAVKFLITEDAKVESRDSFIWGIAISFPLGIIASLLAAFLFRGLRKQ